MVWKEGERPLSILLEGALPPSRSTPGSNLLARLSLAGASRAVSKGALLTATAAPAAADNPGRTGPVAAARTRLADHVELVAQPSPPIRLPPPQSTIAAAGKPMPTWRRATKMTARHTP